MVRVRETARGSAAAAHGIMPGDALVSVNGNEIRDVLDYSFFMTERHVELKLLRGAEEYSVVIDKEEYSDIGLMFGTYLMDAKRRCSNQCVFCFVDQNPCGMRESVYFKDDDERLSFLQGNYITLTNLSKREIERIKQMRISPINVSVHATDPEVRIKMMKNRNAGNVLELIAGLCEAGITVNAQIVLCRGYNDGAQLEKTLSDLSALFPGVASVAVVPCGLTDHREGLAELTPFDRESSLEALGIIERFAKNQLEATGHRLFFASDEFYLSAGRPLPAPEEYEGYPQLDNGVGMLVSLSEEFTRALGRRKKRPIARTVSVATGTAAAGTIRSLCDAACAKFEGLKVNVYEIKNTFFGERITVAGLVTGSDISSQLRSRELGEELLFPRTMLRADGDLFLDGYTPERLSDELGVKVTAVDDDGAGLLKALIGAAKKG